MPHSPQHYCLECGYKTPHRREPAGNMIRIVCERCERLHHTFRSKSTPKTKTPQRAEKPAVAAWLTQLRASLS